MRGWSKFQAFTIQGNRLLKISYDARALMTIPECDAEIVE
jgi:hypothetical protein